MKFLPILEDILYSGYPSSLRNSHIFLYISLKHIYFMENSYVVLWAAPITLTLVMGPTGGLHIGSTTFVSVVGAAHVGDIEFPFIL